MWSHLNISIIFHAAMQSNSLSPHSNGKIMRKQFWIWELRVTSFDSFCFLHLLFLMRTKEQTQKGMFVICCSSYHYINFLGLECLRVWKVVFNVGMIFWRGCRCIRRSSSSSRSTSSSISSSIIWKQSSRWK